MPFADLVFLHSGRSPRCIARVDKRFDGYYTLQFMARGGVELYYGEQRHELSGSWFWTAAPGERIRFHPGAGHEWWEHRYVAFKGPRVNCWIAEGLYFDGPQAAPAGPGGKGYSALFDELLEQTRRHDRWGNTRSINLLERILIELAEERTQPDTKEPWLQQALEYLSKGPATPDYEQLAKASGMSLSTLRRRFKQSTGAALHHYTLQNRIAAACRLLGDGDLPIKAIAEELGYSDVYFFTRQFRRVMGIPPATYRRSAQSAQPAPEEEFAE
jgi:AraC-like DNA-binding protein